MLPSIPTRPVLVAVSAFAFTFVSAASAHAQQSLLSAEQSNPRTMGWMQGAPPPTDKRITVAAGDFFEFPKSRWTVCHIRNLFPSVEVSRGVEAPVPLDYVPHHTFADIRAEIDA